MKVFSQRKNCQFSSHEETKSLRKNSKNVVEIFLQENYLCRKTPWAGFFLSQLL